MCDSKGVLHSGRTDCQQVQAGVRARHEVPHPGGRAEGRRRVRRPLPGGRRDAGDGQDDGEHPHHLRHGEPRPRDHAGGGPLGPLRRRSWRPAARTTRTRSTTCSASPSSSAAPSTCARRKINEPMKQAAVRALAELAQRGDAVPDVVKRAYPNEHFDFGPRLHHPEALRPAGAAVRVPRRGPGRHGDGRRPQAGRPRALRDAPRRDARARSPSSRPASRRTRTSPTCRSKRRSRGSRS